MKIKILASRVLGYLYFPTIRRSAELINQYCRSGYYERLLGVKGSGMRLFGDCVITNPECITIGSNFSADEKLIITPWKKYAHSEYSPQVIIGNSVHLGNNNHITAIDSIKIGDGVLTGSNVFISDHSHGEFSENDLTTPPIDRTLSSKGPVIISNNVWIGNNVCILSGITIGENTTIGANSVVNRSMPSNSVCAGNPCTVLKRIGSDLLDKSK